MTAGELAALHAACFTGTPRPWSAVEFAEMLEQPGVQLFCRAQGFALTRHAGDEAELLTLAVDPVQRRRGTGGGLLAESLAAAKAAGCREMLLEVAEDNVAALKLYEKQGFVQVGLRRDYYRSPGTAPVSALVLKKPLA